MTSLQQAAMTFAVSAGNRIVHVDDVPNGADCGCNCPHCGSQLIAKNGGLERAHHFAHADTSESRSCAETALHLAAKQIIADYKRLALPKVLGNLGGQEDEVVRLEAVNLEHKLTEPASGEFIVADCYALYEAWPLIVEIAVRHHVDDVKAAKIRALSVAALEIDLSDQVGKPWEWGDLGQAVLFDTARRTWIYAPQEAPTSVEAPEVISISGGALNEWKFAIGTTWIWVKELPFGNVRVFHRFDERARRVVEPICRSRGYWNAQYNNWIVFEQFKSELLQTLSAHAKLL